MQPARAKSQSLPIGWWTTVPLLVVLALAAYVLLPRLTELDEALGIVRQLHPWALGLAVVMQAASHVAGGYMVHRVAHLTSDRLSVWHSVRLGLAASAVGLVSAGPVGYAAVTLRWLKRQGFSEQGATLLGWLPALLNASALVALALLGLLQIGVGYGLSLSWPLAAAIVLIACVLLAALALPLLASERWLVSIIHNIRGFWSRVRRRPPEKHTLGADREKVRAARRALGRGGWRGVLLGTVLRSALDALSLYFLFVAAGYDITLGTLMAGYAVPQVAGRIVPGGVGLVEGGMVGLYSALGVPSSTGIVVVLTYRVVSFWLPLLVGVPLAVVEQRAEAQ